MLHKQTELAKHSRCFYNASNKNFKFFKGDFMMHKVASNNMNANWEWIYNYGQIKKGDAVIVKLSV